MVKILDNILKIIYPPKCVVCLELIKMGGHEYLCEECIKSVEMEKGITVKYFGDKNVKHTEYIESGFSVFEYKSIKKSIEHFKFSGFKKDGIYFAKIMTQIAEKNFKYIIDDCDLIVPVPIHSKRRKARGFNQAEIIGENLGKLWGKAYSPNVIVRSKNTLAQNGLSPEERLKNIKGAFSLGENKDIKGKNILVIDDIFTTGSTINECAKVLKKHGAAKVSFYTIAAVIFH